ncbi:kinase [Dactylosporangium vinaceum]|uniref:AAA family ATPase n=1 Tax=Dactylosporangium vinaceum TaxID=53362 RepID=A0ABV5M2Q4_9ACTN|nr:AAA family ATPase [Dactylosporangium vinaceum]
MLLVIRGNSASGKTAAAREARRRAGRGTALIEQDHWRRVVLREHGGLGDDAVAPGFIDVSVRHLLRAGYHVIVEGILHTGGYGPMLRQLITDHPGPSHVFYLDVSFEETVRRHHGRAEPIPVTADDMAGWYKALDVLGVDGEMVLDEDSTLEQTVAAILDVSGLAIAASLTPCPARCPRCAAKQAAGGGVLAVLGVERSGELGGAGGPVC